jgi:hypothetical protein
MEQEIISLGENIFKIIGVIIAMCGIGIALVIFFGAIVKSFMWVIGWLLDD